MASDFDALQPDVILSALEAAGYHPTGEYSQLNSYENRVFDLKLEVTAHAPEPTDRVIAKFYRPGRWSREALRDEQEFLFDLQREGIPAVAPLPLKNGETLLSHAGYLMALFPRVLGRNPQEFLGDELKQVGRTLARIHNIGSRKVAKNRRWLTTQTFGWDALDRLEHWVYPELWRSYEEGAIAILDHLDDNLDESSFIRIHGDCHKGNLLHTGKEFFFVDFDDFCNGPAIQDFWMLLSGTLSDDLANDEQEQICLGYEELREIPDDWHLFEPLRGLRVISYGAWIAQRWNDPFFRRIFPDFNTYNYWLEEVEVLNRIASKL
ncbi:MAG: serine/threonine protein kinase [Bdellovibrionaceae bacterium]|nr:serine/threonine protein kinase [Pseudobdellovibrionaceae bacterium]